MSSVKEFTNSALQLGSHCCTSATNWWQ